MALRFALVNETEVLMRCPSALEVNISGTAILLGMPLCHRCLPTFPLRRVPSPLPFRAYLAGLQSVVGVDTPACSVQWGNFDTSSVTISTLFA